MIYIDLRMRKEGLDLELERYVELRDSRAAGRRPVRRPRTRDRAGVGSGGRSARKRAPADVVLTPLLETPPLDPDAPEARGGCRTSSSKPEYASAEPNAFDRAMQSIRDWFVGLFEGASGIPGPLLALLVILVVVAIVVIGLLVFGLPRLRRSAAARRAAVRRPRPTRPRGASPGGEGRRRGGRLAARDRGAVPGDRARRRRPRPRARASGHDGARRRGCRIRRRSPRTATHCGRAAADFDAVRYLGRSGSRERYEELTSARGRAGGGDSRPRARPTEVPA